MNSLSRGRYFMPYLWFGVLEYIASYKKMKVLKYCTPNDKKKILSSISQYHMNPVHSVKEMSTNTLVNEFDGEVFD